MSSSKITRQAIAAALKELMEHTPLDEITVTQIVERSGVNRKTFYYHFRDKYDLVKWIFETEIAEPMKEDYNAAKWPKSSLLLCTVMQQNKSFYMNALESTAQNSFAEILYNHTRENTERLCHSDAMRAAASEAELDFLSAFMANAIYGVQSEWIKQGMKESPRQLVDQLKFVVKINVERILEREKEDT